MNWFSENWFFILVLITFIAVHLFGHSHHGGHGDSGADSKNDGPNHHVQNGK